MTNLKDINFGLNQYCGPAVLSALTGKSTDECAAVISSINGRQEIKAVEWVTLIKAFEKLRFTCSKQPIRAYSLYGVLTSLSSQDGFYIIGVPRHVVAVEVKNSQIWLVDNHSKSPLPAESSARLMQKVDCVYQVLSKGEPHFLRSEIRIEEFDRNVTIWSYNLYENEEDNTKVRLGQFRFMDCKELESIQVKLNEAIEALRGLN